ncbi:Low-density lipoprotein receptor-related protein 2 [Lamellibrachia satsuma]|nr:Low-density lipoprotein receptor-related protein 2 [Lamellibrachia satsuma]
MQLYVLCFVIGFARNCLGVVQDNFLLVTDSVNDGLFQVDLSTGSGLKIPLSQQTNPIAIGYDPMDSKIYWTDVQDKVIKRSNLDGSVEEVVKSLHKDSVPDGIAIDIAARLVYYTDTDADIIGVMTLDGSQHFTLITEDMDQPRAIVLHPADGLMYWSDWGSSPKIEVAAMDGSQRRVLMSLRSMSWANGLTIDPRAAGLRAAGLPIFGPRVWAGPGPNTHGLGRAWAYVSKINVFDPTPTPEQVGPDLFSHPNGIVAYSRGNNAYDVQMNSSCSYLNGGCKHVCLATPTGHRCACPDGLNFVNGTECSIPMYTCPEEYTAKKGRIRSPGYPGYRNNLHCVIIIRLNNTQHEQRRIRLYVEDFDVPDKHDYFLIEKNKVTGSRLQRYSTYTGVVVMLLPGWWFIGWLLV